MRHDLLQSWAALNHLTIADQPFGLHALAVDPPAGAEQVATPNAENAACLLDATGQPAAIVFMSWGGQWMRETSDLCRWLKLSAFGPPAPRDKGERHFIVIRKAGAAEPKWLPEQR